MIAAEESLLIDQLCGFSAALQLLCDLHTPGCFMVKRDNHRAFFFSNSPLGSIIIAMATVQICKAITAAYPRCTHAHTHIHAHSLRTPSVCVYLFCELSVACCAILRQGVRKTRPSPPFVVFAPFRYAVTPKIGIATDPAGTAFIFPNDYYGACLNLASKLGEDHAKSGQVSVYRRTAWTS
jgi:hypothetical protein